MATYWEKLKDPRWQRKRLEIMERDGFKCRRCHTTSAPLNVHHGYYAPGNDPWDYEDETLITLCEDCHEEIQSTLTDIHREIACCDLIKLDAILDFLRGQIREDIRLLRVSRAKKLEAPKHSAMPENLTEEEEIAFLRKILQEQRDRQGIVV